MAFPKTLRLLSLSLALSLLSTAAITAALYTVLLMICPGPTQDFAEANPDHSDDLNSTEILLRMLNSPQPTANTLADPNPDLSQIPQQLLRNAQTALVFLLTALITNLISLGMTTQSLCENAGVASGGEAQQTARPLRIPDAQREESLALHIPEEGCAARGQGGVGTVGTVTSAPLPDVRDDRRGAAGREVAAAAGTLRRSKATNDLHMMQLGCTQDQARTFDWRAIAELSARTNQDASTLRLRPNGTQCRPNHQEDFPQTRFQ